MNYLLAKLKGRNDKFLKVIASKHNILDVPNLTRTHNYTSTYKLDDDEWFQLDNFKNRGYSNALIRSTFSGTTFNQITIDEYSKIKYLCSKQNDYYLFQKMSETQVLSKKWFHIQDSPSLQINKPIIVINDWIDAIYNKNNDTLYFKDIVKIKHMFHGIEILYREATLTEVNSFLTKNFISLGQGFTSSSVNVANRRRIAMALDTLSHFTPQEVLDIISYTISYCTDITCLDNAFVIHTEEHLKLVLFGIEQRFYTTRIGAEKRIANSILQI